MYGIFQMLSFSQKEDRRAEEEGRNTIMKYHPRKSSITFQSLMTTLYYCALYHFDKVSRHLTHRYLRAIVISRLHNSCQ